MNDTVDDMNIFNSGFEFQSVTYVLQLANTPNNLVQQQGCSGFVLKKSKEQNAITS